MTGKRKAAKADAAHTAAGAGTEIVNIRVPKELILEIDFLVKKRVFKSRSEAIREFAREYVQGQLPHSNAKISERGGRGW